MAQKPVITIVGTGLIGTSLGMAILSARGRDIEIIGHDVDFAQARLAQRMGALTRAERNLISACAQADLIILSTPTAAIHETLRLIAEDLKSGCVITDTAAVKVPILEWTKELLPSEVSYVGGDPILFGDEAGIDSARADLFKEAYYCIVPSEHASSESVKLISDLVAMVGAIPLFIDPHEHDGLIGGTEHLADILAASFLGTLTNSAGWRDMRRMAGATFDRVTCFSQADPVEYRSRALLNKDVITRWIDAFQAELGNLRRMIQEEQAEEIERYYRAQMDARLQWLQDRASQDWGDMPKKTEIPSAGEFMSQMLLGGFGRRRTEE